MDSGTVTTRGLAICVAIVVFLNGCSWFQPTASSSHTLAPSPRVQTVVKNGELVYVRDGKVFKRLSKAVAGDADAERAAQQYVQKRESGKRWMYWYFPGLVAMAAGQATSDIYTGTPESWQNENVSLAFMSLGTATLILTLIGFKKFKDSETHKYDAINIFNEGVMHEEYPPSVAPIETRP